MNKHDRSFGSASAAIQRNVIALKGIEDPLRATGRNAFTMGRYPSSDAALRNPTTGIAACCPRAASGHAAAADKRG